MYKFLLIIALAVAAYFGIAPSFNAAEHRKIAVSPEASLVGRDTALENAFINRLNNQQLAGSGAVVKILPDDIQGSRHQRFIIRLSSGRTVLVSHNIDLARRLDLLAVGDTVAFYGEYEWNPKGGVMHWTHHDPEGRHVAGWINHKGQTYQ